MKQAILAGAAALGLLGALPAASQTSGTGDRHDVLGVRPGQGSSQTGSSALGERSGSDGSTGVIGAPAGTPGNNHPAQPGGNAGAGSPTDGASRAGAAATVQPDAPARLPGNPNPTANSDIRDPVLGVQRGQGSSQTGSSALAQRDAYRSRQKAYVAGPSSPGYVGAAVVDSQGRPVGQVADVVSVGETTEIDHVVITTDRFGAAEPQAYLVVTMARLQPAPAGAAEGYVLEWDDAGMADAPRYQRQDDAWLPR